MINELIEKEIEKTIKLFLAGQLSEDCLRLSLQTIAKEVAMKFKEHNYGSYYINKDKIELLADQIINEVSE